MPHVPVAVISPLLVESSSMVTFDSLWLICAWDSVFQTKLPWIINIVNHCLKHSPYPKEDIITVNYFYLVTAVLCGRVVDAIKLNNLWVSTIYCNIIYTKGFNG